MLNVEMDNIYNLGHYAFTENWGTTIFHINLGKKDQLVLIIFTERATTRKIFIL